MTINQGLIMVRSLYTFWNQLLRKIRNILQSAFQLPFQLWVASLVAIGLALFWQPSQALAWKPTTHVYLGQQALNDALDDGKVTIPRVDYEKGEITGTIGTYAVDPTILAALRSNAAQYRAGILGPDAYPDILTGQQVIHPSDQETGISGGSNTWLQYLWDRANTANTPAIRAFTVGYLTHAAGDMYGHTFVNNFSGGSFAITPPKGPANAIKHIVVEGYTDKRLDSRALDANFFNASIDGVSDFIYSNMIDARPGTALDGQLLRNGGGGTEFSVPRIYSTMRAKLQREIDGYYATKADYDRRIDNCRLTDFTCSKTILLAQKAAYMTANAIPTTYKEAWRDDIDSGLRAWPGVSHEVAKALFFNPARSADTQRAEDVLQRYVTDHLLSMSGAPDFVGLTAGAISDIVAAITPDFLLQPIRQLKEDLLNTMLKAAIGMTKQELKQYLTSPDKYFDQVLGSGAGENTNLKAFNSKYLKISDPGYSNPSESFNPQVMAAAYNTMTMSKLIMLGQGEINRLMSDLGSPARLQTANVMLGFIRTLDGDNQWPNGMVLARDCNAYRQVFMKQPGETGCTVANNPTPTPQPAALQWVAASGGQVPGGAVLGGQEPGRSLYICRAGYQNGVHPGKVVASNCNISYGGREIEIRNYEVLTNPGQRSLRWVTASGGQVPGGAVLGGQEPGRSLYICRAGYQNGVHPGKVVASNCNIGYGGKEIEIRSYEVLTAP
ncbi:DUF3421 domain-containing protein [Alkalinema pantanalense CENA528]|uniref:DUF3421 domain-containing protein n=1 Tax=Alkalinema pantanalense TaxID=1620705 RepID=UPI003D6EDE65